MQQLENLPELFLGEIVKNYVLFHDGHFYRKEDYEVICSPKEQFTDWISHAGLIVGFDIVNAIIEIEDANDCDLSRLFRESKVIDLKILFQLVSLATEGSLFVPSNIYDLNKTLRIRRLICPNIEDDDSASIRLETIKVCHDYLEWKVRKINGSNSLTHDIQIRADYALRKIEKIGYAIDRQQVENLSTQTKSKIQDELQVLESYGWCPGVGSESRYEEIIESLKQSHVINLPITKTGKVSSAERHLGELSASIPFFKAYLGFFSFRKLQSTYLEKMNVDVLHPHYNTLVSTGRTSSFDPNFQNFPRDEAIRRCFIPRSGYKLLVADYSTVELCALAQTCITRFGFSRMGELINSGVDLHRWFASIILKKSEDQVSKQERAYAKACNFGFPGGLGVKQFLEYAKHTYGIDDLDLKTAKIFKTLWLESFPEMNLYLSAEGHAYRSKATTCTITGRLRAGCTFTQAKNFPFQGLAADGAKISLFNLIASGFRVLNYVHDEFVIELLDDESLAKRRSEAEQIMVQGMKDVCPHVEIRIESEVCDYWKKL